MVSKNNPNLEDTICYKFGKFYKETLLTSLLVTSCIIVILISLVLNILITTTVDIKWWWLLVSYLVYIILKIMEGVILVLYYLKNQWPLKTLIKIYSTVWSIENIVLTSLLYELKDQLVDADYSLGWMLIPVVCFGFTSSLCLFLYWGICQLYVTGKCCDCIDNIVYCFEICFVTPILACKNGCKRRGNDGNNHDVETS